MTDIKGEMMQIAEEIAEEVYGKEFYDLKQATQDIVWRQAESEWTDKNAGRYDV